MPDPADRLVACVFGSDKIPLAELFHRALPVNGFDQSALGETDHICRVVGQQAAINRIAQAVLKREFDILDVAGIIRAVDDPVYGAIRSIRFQHGQRIGKAATGRSHRRKSCGVVEGTQVNKIIVGLIAIIH